RITQVELHRSEVQKLEKKHAEGAKNFVSFSTQNISSSRYEAAGILEMQENNKTIIIGTLYFIIYLSGLLPYVCEEDEAFVVQDIEHVSILLEIYNLILCEFGWNSHPKKRERDLILGLKYIYGVHIISAWSGVLFFTYYNLYYLNFVQN
ncbi:hypothetical protein ACJX0J_025321, partial [Zea mays]